MTLFRGSSTGLIARILAIALVIGWTIVPGLCGGQFENEHTHADVAAGDHVTADHDAHHKLVSCCRTLASAKVLLTAPPEVQPTKIILVAVIDKVGKAVDETSQVSEPVAAATGPPRTRSTRLFSYSPLAPPTHSA